MNEALTAEELETARSVRAATWNLAEWLAKAIATIDSLTAERDTYKPFYCSGCDYQRQTGAHHDDVPTGDAREDCGFRQAERIRVLEAALRELLNDGVTKWLKGEPGSRHRNAIERAEALFGPTEADHVPS